MIKFLMGLITTVTSFISLFINTNSAMATPIVTSEVEPFVANTIEQPVNLNTSGSLWQLNNTNAKNIFDHLGCSCAACGGTVKVNSL